MNREQRRKAARQRGAMEAAAEHHDRKGTPGVSVYDLAEVGNEAGHEARTQAWLSMMAAEQGGEVREDIPQVRIGGPHGL